MKLQWLSDFDGRRDNNFTLIRLVLASTVLFAHSYALTGVGLDPISKLIHPYTAIQAMAVEGFFIISGFLVIGSLVNRGPIQYAFRRALRIFPGYWVCLFLFVVIIGPMISALPTAEYFAHGWTVSHFTRGFYIFDGAQGRLPGVFLDHGRYSEMFNGSLWTLPVEIRCYVFLGGLGILALLFGKKSLTILILATVVLGFTQYDQIPILGRAPRWTNLVLCFAIGSLAWLHRDKVPLSLPLAAAAFLMPFLFAGMPAFQLSLAISMAYVIFYVAFATRQINIDRFGDISFGVYIYAWPVQQLVMWPGQGGATNAILAAMIVFPAATASWFFVEKPALNLIHMKRKPDAAAEPTL